MIPRIAITPGEPGGIGPELLVQLAQQGHRAQLVVIADPTLLADTAQRLQLPLTICEFSTESRKPQAPASIQVLPVKLQNPATPGRLDPDNARYVLDTLKAAADGCLDDTFDAVVTGPVHKGVINDAGIRFSGHTEFFAEVAGVDKVVMMLAADDLRVALVTTHLPLAEVSPAITPANLTRTLEIVDSAMHRQFGIEKPRISVCGLNPHAGEGGHMGREEIEIIEPVMALLRKRGMDLTGPLPADTLFTPPRLADADAVIAMYHDQGLPVLKFKGFGRAVNITLGLPFIRTSVDHGTALDLAGSGRADCGSFRAALAQAISMAAR